MKKFIALILSLTLLFSFVTVANAKDIWDDNNDGFWDAYNTYWEAHEAFLYMVAVYDRYTVGNTAQAEVFTAASEYFVLSEKFKTVSKSVTPVYSEHREKLERIIKYTLYYDYIAADPIRYIPSYKDFYNMQELYNSINGYVSVFKHAYIKDFISLYDKQKSYLTKSEWEQFASQTISITDELVEQYRTVLSIDIPDSVQNYLDCQDEFDKSIAALVDIYNDIIQLRFNSENYNERYAELYFELKSFVPDVVAAKNVLQEAYNAMPLEFQREEYPTSHLEYAIASVVRWCDEIDHYLKLDEFIKEIYFLASLLPWDNGRLKSEEFERNEYLIAEQIVIRYESLSETDKYYACLVEKLIKELNVILKPMIRGDLSGEGNTNGKDLLILKKILLGRNEYSDNVLEQADVNFDDAVNGMDLLTIKKRILSIYKPIESFI